MRNDIRDIAIIGAGMAGLACATQLVAEGCRTRLFDKARGAGGRMSMRHIDTVQGDVAVDHGAQYFTARDAAFRRQVDQWCEAGLAAPWPAAGKGAFVGTPAMNAPLQHMADALDVHWSRHVRAIEAIEADSSRWRLVDDASDPLSDGGTFDTVVIAVPAEQAAPLLRAHVPAMSACTDVTRSQPCWTLMLAFAEPVAFDGDVLRDSGDVGWACRNSAKPGRGAIETWVVQGSAAWSRAHLEDAADAVADALAHALQIALGIVLPPPLARQAHRWRYARSGQASTSLLWDRDRRIGACGDWLLGPRVECAWLSGVALANAILRG